MLIENTLFGKHDKIAIALDRIRAFEPVALQLSPAGYHMCVSGGKDSSAIQELCVMSGARVKTNFFNFLRHRKNKTLDRILFFAYS